MDIFSNIKSNSIESIEHINNFKSNENLKKTVPIEIKENTKINEKNENLSIDKTNMNKIVEELNKLINNEFIEFGYNEEINVFTVFVKRKETNEIISQFPTEDFIKRLKAFNENNNKNFFLNKKI